MRTALFSMHELLEKSVQVFWIHRTNIEGPIVSKEVIESQENTKYIVETLISK